jgi:hypothetical protein
VSVGHDTDLGYTTLQLRYNTSFFVFVLITGPSIFVDLQQGGAPSRPQPCKPAFESVDLQQIVDAGASVGTRRATHSRSSTIAMHPHSLECTIDYVTSLVYFSLRRATCSSIMIVRSSERSPTSVSRGWSRGIDTPARVL